MNISLNSVICVSSGGGLGWNTITSFVVRREIYPSLDHCNMSLKARISPLGKDRSPSIVGIDALTGPG